MRLTLIAISAAVATIVAANPAASAARPTGTRASCVAVITSYEASQLAPGSVGNEVSGLAGAPGLGSAVVSPLAKDHFGSIENCRDAN